MDREDAVEANILGASRESPSRVVGPGNYRPSSLVQLHNRAQELGRYQRDRQDPAPRGHPRQPSPASARPAGVLPSGARQDLGLRSAVAAAAGATPLQIAPRPPRSTRMTAADRVVRRLVGVEPLAVDHRGGHALHDCECNHTMIPQVSSTDCDTNKDIHEVSG